MKKEESSRGSSKIILLVLGIILLVFFVLVPLAFAFFDGSKTGNVALIPLDGPLTANGESLLGAKTVSSSDIVNYIKDAEENSHIKVILLEINSPGGSAVASDEISSAVKKAKKPVITLIREVGASGGYWVASASDYIIANRMSITGSIGVTSSYLEFSGLMEKYGVGYEQLTAGEHKELGTPFEKLSAEDRAILQEKLDKIQEFFIAEIAANRHLEINKVREMATGEFFLGVEGQELGLVDQLGDKSTAEDYLKKNYNLTKIDYVTYQKEVGLIDLLTSVWTDFSFNIGQCLGSIFLQQEKKLILM